MTTTRETVTLWACIDCRTIEANGGDHGTDPDYDYSDCWRIDQGPGVITPGLIDTEHAEDCPVFPVIDEDGTRDDFHGHEECGCEDQSFSWTPCDACGSPLGGSRHAYTYHFTDEEVRAINAHVPERGPWG